MQVEAGGSAPLSDVSTPQLGGHVLLVEDEAVNAAVAEGYLSALGCTLAWVKNGNDAVARAGAERFDLIFMDLNMPGIDGFTAAKLIREREASAGNDRRARADHRADRARCRELPLARARRADGRHPQQAVLARGMHEGSAPLDARRANKRAAAARRRRLGVDTAEHGRRSRLPAGATRFRHDGP